MKHLFHFFSLVLMLSLLLTSCVLSPAKPPLEGVGAHSDSIQNGTEPVWSDIHPDTAEPPTEPVTDAPFDPNRPFIVYTAQALEDGTYNTTAENAVMTRVPNNLSFNRGFYPTVEKKYERADKTATFGREAMTLSYRRTEECTDSTLSAEGRAFYSYDIYTDGVGQYIFYANTDIIKDISAKNKLAVDKSLPLITEEEAGEIAKTFLRENAGCLGVDNYIMTVEPVYRYGHNIFKVHFQVILDGYTTNEKHLLYISYNGVIGGYSSGNGGTFSRYEGEIHDELIEAAKRAANRCTTRAELVLHDQCRLVFGSDGKLYLAVVTYTREYDETDDDMNVLKHHPYTEYIYYVCLDPVEKTS